MAEKNPKTVTIRGRLSYPTFTAEQAHALSQSGLYPTNSAAEATPTFNMLVEKDQLDKLMRHAQDVFLPYVIERSKAGEKKDALTAGEVKKLVTQLDDPTEWAEPTFNTPFKPVPEKTVEYAPEAVASITVRGSKGQDMELMAIVTDESELAVPDPDILKYPVIKPINETKHNLYAGCYVVATLNLYAYKNGNNPGFSASSNTPIFKADGPRIGGGVDIDEDEIFLD